MKTPIRVLHLYRTYFPETQGGLQESIRQLCLATTAQGVQNTVFALARRPNPSPLQLPEGTLVRARSWVEIASCDFGGWAAFQQARKAADAADILQIHYPWPFVDLLLPWIRRRNQPVVVTYVSDIVRQRYLGRLYDPLQRYLLRTASRLVASTENYAQSSAVLQKYKEKVVCIAHCLGPAGEPDAEKLAYWRARLGSGYFLFVGVLRYYKGLDFLLEAAAKVNVPIVVIGDGPEGQRLRELAQLRGITNVQFLGAVSDADKFAILAHCCAVVLPSHLRSEAFGMMLLEGARAGKALISCDIKTGTSWINLHGETGLVVPPADPNALAHALQELAQNAQFCQQLGEGALRRWQGLFSHEPVASAYVHLYRELLLTHDAAG